MTDSNDMPDRIMAWHGSENIKHAGTWATTRHQEDAVVFYRDEAEQCAVVKPLEWEWNGASFGAKTIIGEYRVSKTMNKSNDRYMVTHVNAYRKSNTVCYVDGEKSAKAAAQADYERRIRSAITIRPASDVSAEARSEAIEAAKNMAKTYYIDAGSTAYREHNAGQVIASAIDALHAPATRAALERKGGE